MSIFDRLGRIARAEVSELKRVLREAREEDGLPDVEGEERERQRLIAEAEAELARAETDVLAAEIEAGAAAWGTPRGAVAADAEIARGAELWARGGDEGARGGDEGSRGAGGIGPVRTEPSASAREARVGAFTREVREAYAALELPLGADRGEIEGAFVTLSARYHPDRHASAPHLQAAANELTIRIRAARDLLLAWLDGA